MSAFPTLSEDVIGAGTSDHGGDNGGLQNRAPKSDTMTNGKRHSPEVNGFGAEWQPHDTPVENQRPIKVIIIGCGYSGVYCGIRIPERIRNCELVIYEKNAGIGGTWYENRYPGAACDVPSHSYQFSFNPKPDWSALYAPAPEIRDYIESTATKYGVRRFVRLEHEVVGCEWNANEGKWEVEIKRPDGAVFKDTSDILITARGALNRKMWPDIPGLHNLQGPVMHSAAWDESFDYTNKRIGLIGTGSSAIQILPQLQALPGTQLHCFMRGRTWISPPFAQGTQDRLGLEGFSFPPELIAKFKSDPSAWFDFRLGIEAESNGVHAITRKGSTMQRAAKAAFEEGMRQRLSKKPHYYDWLRPGFSPGCRRLTPGPGFLEALVEDNVQYIREKIERVDPKGVVTEDGKLHEIDVLVCATGFHVSSAPSFPVMGQDGKLLSDHWHERATNYMSLATDRFPNMFIMLGPNGGVGEGSLTMVIESVGDYIVKAIRKIQKENIKSVVIKPERVHDFCQYSDEHFKRTVFSEECRSWYKKDGQGRYGSIVTGLWPGSTLHCIETLRSPRWEDYEYEYHAEPNGAPVNQLAWMGNGWAMNQLNEHPRKEDLAFYILPQFQDRDLGRPAFPLPEENEAFHIRPWSY